ncbi:MAG: sugar phosphate isomerase/epimerase family protein [Candidatus Methylomirabilales bacterium]
MRDALHAAMKVGIVHFMAYPECLRGEGPVVETVHRILEDDFFGAIEVTQVKDPAAREAVARLCAQSHVQVGYGAQPVLLTEKLNLNSLDAAERKRAVERMKACVDEAAILGATAFAVLSGPNVRDRREEAMQRLVDSLLEIGDACAAKGLQLLLEIFDYDIDKKCLIGPSRDGAKVSRAVRKRHKDFGLTLDLSHLPLQHETPKQAFAAAKGQIAHIHIGNCVLQAGHPAYGDQHPRFGLPGGENDVRELVAFLKELFAIGYLGKGKRPLVAFEVKPQPGESSGAVIAGSKRALLDAWARL